MNTVCIDGRIAKDIELKTTHSGNRLSASQSLMMMVGAITKRLTGLT